MQIQEILYNQEIINSFKESLEYICNDSANLSYLKNFSSAYVQHMQRVANKVTDLGENRETLIEMKKMVDKIILYKLTYSKCEGILDHVDCMGELRDVINNVYIRYRIYDYCYTFGGAYYLNLPNGREQFIKYMKDTYFRLRGLFRNFPDTDTIPKSNKKGSGDRLVEVIKNACK